MLAKDALEIVLNPVIDRSHLNRFVLHTPFKVETVTSVLLSVQEVDFLSSIDLKDVYFQILVHQSSRKLLRFLSEGVVYQFKALCFGLSTAPQVFTSVCSGLCMGSLPRDSSSLAPGRLAGPRLFGGRGQKERPRCALALSLPRDSDKREVRSHSLADCKLPRYDHRYQGRQDFSCPGASREISVGGGEISCFVRSPRSALAGAFGAPGFAGEVGSSQSS